MRYLLGIVRNIAHEREGLAIAKALWTERINAREFVFDSLIRKRDSISISAPDAGLLSFIDEALTVDHQLERHFWLDAAAAVVLGHSPDHRRAVFERAARRIHTSYRVSHDRRLTATRALATMVLPLD